MIRKQLLRLKACCYPSFLLLAGKFEAMYCYDKRICEHFKWIAFEPRINVKQYCKSVIFILSLENKCWEVMDMLLL